jgi:hypothetical protein
MVVRFLVLALLVTIASAFALPDTPQVHALSSALLATAVLGTAIFTSSSAIIRLTRRVWPLLVLALAAPAAWMVLQVVPVPRGFGSPIWETASAALNAPLSERLTVDVRATVQSLIHYNAIVALAFVTAIVALDRQRAWQLLVILISIAAIVCARSIVRQMMVPDGLSRGDAPSSIATGAAAAALGLLLSTAMIAGAFAERRRVRQPSASALRLATSLSFALLAILIFLATVLLRAETGVALAALLGAGIVLAVFAIRNWFYGVWGTAGVLATAAVLFLAALTLLPLRQNADLTIALSRHSQPATERMLQEAGLAGSGGGTYATLLPIHRDMGTIASRERPTAAAAIAIEMGRAFLYGLLIIAVLGAWTFLRRSLRPGYDYVYAAIGSAAAVSLTMMAFVDDGMLEFGPSLLAAALFGLAVAQSQPATAAGPSHSRSSRSTGAVNSPDPAGAPTRSSWLGNASMRAGLGVIAVMLIAQSLWILVYSSHPGNSPIGQSAVSATSIPSDGDLRPSTLSAAPPSTTNETTAARPEFGAEHAALNAAAGTLRYSPLRGDLWLKLAAISKEQRSTGYDIVALLKLSYYTAPNDLELLPLRLTVSLGVSSVLSEPELRELVQRDVKIALTKQSSLRPALIAAYQSASPEGKGLVDDLKSEWDSATLQGMRNRIPPPGTDLPPPNRTPGRSSAR